MSNSVFPFVLTWNLFSSCRMTNIIYFLQNILMFWFSGGLFLQFMFVLCGKKEERLFCHSSSEFSCQFRKIGRPNNSTLFSALATNIFFFFHSLHWSVMRGPYSDCRIVELRCCNSFLFFESFSVMSVDVEANVSSHFCFPRCSHRRVFLLGFIFQDTPVGKSIFMVNATDPDQGTGGSVLFSFQPPSPFFAIDGARGTVTVTRPLDYETTTAYQLTVNATVSTHTSSLHTPSLSSKCVQIVNLLFFLFLFYLGSRQTEAAVSACQPSHLHHGCTGHGPHLHQSALQHQLTGERSPGQLSNLQCNKNHKDKVLREKNTAQILHLSFSPVQHSYMKTTMNIFTQKY